MGNDELYEAFQTGYSMEKYAENNSCDYTAYLLDKYHRKTELLNSEKVEEGEADTKETHFSIIMDILNNIGSKEAISVYNLWLEPLEENILIQKEWLLNSNKYEIVFGEYDEPKHQKRGIFRHNLIKGGHIGIFGNAACGKSTFLQTCLYSFIKKENPAIINIYIIDYSNRLLAQFQNSHMVGAYITEEEQERVVNLIVMLKDIMKERKALWKGIVFEQRLRDTKCSEPAIVLVIDNYGCFREKTQNQYDNDIVELLKFGETYGIYLILSGNSIGSGDIPSKVFENIKTPIALRLNDKYQYAECMRQTGISMLPDSSVKGRGIARIGSDILEFQTALAISNNDLDRMKGIDFEIAMRNKEWGTMCAAMLPYIPDKPRLSELEAMYISQDVKELPIGYIKESARILTLNTDMLHRFVIGGRIKSGKTNLLKNIEYFLIRNKSSYEYMENLSEIIDISKKNIGDIYILSDSITELIDRFYRNDFSREEEQKILDIIDNSKNIHIISTFSTEAYTKVAGRKIFEGLKKAIYGIYLGGNMETQNLFDFSYMPFSKQCKKLDIGLGVIPKVNKEWYQGEVVIPLYENKEAI